MPNRTSWLNLLSSQCRETCLCCTAFPSVILIMHNLECVIDSRVTYSSSQTGEQSEPQSENLTDIDWNCLLSKLLHLLMPKSNSKKIPFRATIILKLMKDI